MSDNLRSRVAELLAAHNYPADRMLRQTDDGDMYYLCGCGEHISVLKGRPSHRDHLVDVLDQVVGAEVEKLRSAIESIRDIVRTALGKPTWRVLDNIAAVIQRIEKP